MTIFPAVLFSLFLLAVVSGAVLGILMHVKDDEWRPIDTAPKDGTDILTSISWEPEPGASIRVLTWSIHGEKWVTSHNWKPVTSQPTHWKPLPPI